MFCLFKLIVLKYIGEFSGYATILAQISMKCHGMFQICDRERRKIIVVALYIAMSLSRGLLDLLLKILMAWLVDIIHVFIMSVHDPCACGMNIWLCMCAVACLCERASAYVYASVCVCAVIWKEGKKNDRYLLLSCMWNCYYPKGFSPAGQCIWVPQRNDSISHRQQNLIKTKTVSTAYLFQFACPSPHFDCCCLEHKQEVHFRAPSRR